MSHVVMHKNGEIECIVQRIQYPGKNTGWLGVGERNNVWLITGPVGYWICDWKEAGADSVDRKKLVQFTRQIMETEASMETAMTRAAAGVRDGRAGYQVIDVGDIDITDRTNLYHAIERIVLTEWFNGRKENNNA